MNGIYLKIYIVLLIMMFNAFRDLQKKKSNVLEYLNAKITV